MSCQRLSLLDLCERNDLADAARATPKLDRKTPRITRMRTIVENGQAVRMEGKLVDTFTASAYVKVAEALNETNRAKLEALPLSKAVALVWKLLK